MTVQNLGTTQDGGSEIPLYTCWETSWQVGGEGAGASAIGEGLGGTVGSQATSHGLALRTYSRPGQMGLLHKYQGEEVSAEVYLQTCSLSEETQLPHRYIIINHKRGKLIIWTTLKFGIYIH